VTKYTLLIDAYKNLLISIEVKLVRKPISLGIFPVNEFKFKSKNAAQKRKKWINRQIKERHRDTAKLLVLLDSEP
jgi:hypothetical protein